MVAKGKASAKRKQDKAEEEQKEQEQAQKRNKKQEEEQQQEADDAAAADEAEDPDGSDAEFEEGDEDEGDEGESSDGEPGNTDIFEAEIKERERQLNKHCMVVGALDEDDEDEEAEEGESDEGGGRQPSLEQLRALARVFVPKKVEEYYEELARELSKIGDDEEDEDDDDDEAMDPGLKAAMKGFSIRMLSTKHSYPMQDLLKASLSKSEKAIKGGRWQEGFSRWAATLQAARRETHWFQDTDVPKVAEGIYEKLRSQWQKLQARSDQELGGLVCEGAESSKEAFSAFLQALAEEMRSVELKVKDAV